MIADYEFWDLESRNLMESILDPHEARQAAKDWIAANPDVYPEKLGIVHGQWAISGDDVLKFIAGEFA